MSTWRGLRHPKTTQERRANECCPVKVRAARSGWNLPNALDDISPARRGRCDRHKNHRRLAAKENLA